MEIMFIILMILGAVGGFIYALLEGIEWWELIVTPFFGMLVAIAVWLVLLLIMLFCCLGAEFEMVPEPVETVELVSLKDRYGIDGYIGHWHGSVEDEPKYSYLYKDEEGWYHTGQIDAKHTAIKESADTDKVILYVYETRPKSDVLYWFMGNCGNDQYRIVAPEGTIVFADEYVVDLE